MTRLTFVIVLHAFPACQNAVRYGGCGHPFGGDTLEPVEPGFIDQELMATFETPADHAPTTLRVRGFGDDEASPAVGPEDWGEYCLEGALWVSGAQVDVDVDFAGVRYTFEAPLGSMEREVEGEGIHVTATLSWEPDDLPHELRGPTEAAVARARALESGLSAHELRGGVFSLVHQQGSSRPASGFVSYYAPVAVMEGKNEVLGTQKQVSLFFANLSMPDTPEER